MSIVYVKSGKHIKYSQKKTVERLETPYEKGLKLKKQQLWDKKRKTRRKIRSQKRFQIAERESRLRERLKFKKVDNN